MSSAVKGAFFILTFAVFSPEVTSWMVDMAKVEKLLDEKQNREHPDNYNSNSSSVASESDNEVRYTSNYADNFHYRIFRKKNAKEVDNVFKNGAVYLEGLSGALAAYRAVLENCTKSSSKIGEYNPEQLKACVRAEQKRRVVQELSRLALSTTGELRDKAFDNINQGASDESELVQLARSLERLASLTGAGPVRDTPGAAGSPDNSPISTTEANANGASEDIEQNLEILEQVENGRPPSYFPLKPLTDVKSVQKRDVSDVMKYYVKYKVWNASNPIDDHRSDDIHHFDVKNSFKLSVRKRSVTDKKAANMRSVIQTKRLKCKLKDHLKNKSKLVKFIKVYRRKIFRNTTSH